VVNILRKIRKSDVIRPMGVDNNHIFNKLSLRRPAVQRKGDKVMKCFYWEGTKECLGPQCFWVDVGICSIYRRLKIKFKAK